MVLYKFLPNWDSLPPSIRKLGAFLLPHIDCAGNLEALSFLLSFVVTVDGKSK